MSEWKETALGRIPFDWDFINSSDFCIKITDGTHDSPKQQRLGKYLITSKHIKGRNIYFDNAYLISEIDYKKINERSRVDQWDVIISMIGEYCGFAYLERNETIDYAVKNVGIFKTGNKDKSFWLYYYIQSLIGKNYLDNCRSGTSQPYLSLEILRKFPILVPSKLEEQKAIASVLSSLDDKIDLLHRQNKTLEAMAETLFRQWFVEEAEGWKDGILGDVLELIYGKALKEDVRTGGEYPVVGSNGVVGHHAEYLVKGPGIVIGRKGTLGKVIYLFENFFPIDTTYYIKSKINSTGMLYEYFLLKTLSFENSDSAVPGLNRNIALSEEIKIPQQNSIEEFNEICASFFSKMKVNINQIRTLETLRDTLLPKLMSGEVRVDYP